MAGTAIKFVPDGNKFIPTAVDPTVNITVQSTAIDNNTGVIVQKISLAGTVYDLKYYPILDNDNKPLNGRYAVSCKNGGKPVQLNVGYKLDDFTIYNVPENEYTKMSLFINRLELNKFDSTTNKPLTNVQFELQDNNNVIASGTTDAEGKIVFEQSLTEGTYTLVETAVPEGYKEVSVPVTFTVKKETSFYNNGQIEREIFTIDDLASSDTDIFDLTKNEYLIDGKTIRFESNGAAGFTPKSIGSSDTLREALI